MHKKKGVTTWIKQFIPEFDKETISKIVARKENKTQEEVLKEWDKLGSASIDLGNAIHKIIDYYVKYKKIPKNIFFANIIIQFTKIVGKSRVKSEVYIEDDDVCGIVDLIEYIDDKKINIHDYKTAHSLYKNNGKLLKPYEYLDNNSLNEYRLQLSKYKEILEKQGFIVNKLKIWNFTNTFEVIEIEPIIFK